MTKIVRKFEYVTEVNYNIFSNKKNYNNNNKKRYFISRLLLFACSMKNKILVSYLIGCLKVIIANGHCNQNFYLSSHLISMSYLGKF